MQHHLFYRLLIISCTFFLISCQQTIECYLIPSTDKASDFHKVQPQNSGTLFLAKNEAEHIQIVFKGCPGETYKIHRNENADNSKKNVYLYTTCHKPPYMYKKLL